MYTSIDYLCLIPDFMSLPVSHGKAASYKQPANNHQIFFDNQIPNFKKP